MRYANKITAFRLLAIPFFIYTVLSYSKEEEYLRYLALGIFFLAVISDALDGIVARLKKENTRLGAILDPLADKLLLMSAYLFLFIKGPVFLVKLPLWLVLAVVCRDLVILLGTFLIFIVRQDVRIIPSAWGKMTTFLQMLTVIALLLEFKYSHFIWPFVAIFTIISGVDYIRKGISLFTFSDKLSTPSNR